MAQLIFENETHKVYRVTDPDDRNILPLGYWSLRDPFSTRGYMTAGNIYIFIDKSKELVTCTFDFFKQENKEQVVGILPATFHYRDRVNNCFDFYTFLEKNPEFKEIPSLKEDIKKYPIVKDYFNY